MKTTDLNRPASLALAALFAMTLPLPALTQSNSNANDEDLEEILVVGSRLSRGSVQDSPLPIDSIGGEEVRNSGYTDVGLSLEEVVPSFNYSFSSITDGTDSVFPATLRGLDPDQTLVLLDGKRRHASALVHVNASVARGSAGVDINAVPSVAFERIDVLRDGASALYGSDAIAGVIDLRLKRTSPATIDFHSGGYSEGDGDATRLSFSWGGAISDNGTLFVAAETRDLGRTNRAGLMGTQNYPALLLSEVDSSHPQLADYNAHVAGGGSSDGCDADFNLLCDPREFTLQRQTFRVGDPDTEQQSFVVNAVFDVSGGQVYANSTYSTRTNLSGCYYRQANDEPRNNTNIYPDGFLPLIHTDIEDFSITGGYRWQSDKGQYDISISQGDNSYDFGLRNSHNDSLGDVSQTSFDAGGPRYGQFLVNFDATYNISDKIRLAYGAESRSETYELASGEANSYAAGPNDNPADFDMDNPNAPTPPEGASFRSNFGSQCFPGFRPRVGGEKSRDNLSAYAEVALDFDALQVNAAARLESYSDFGEALTWRGAALYRISDSFRVRGSIGTSLRAPSLPQLFYSTSSTLSIDGELVETATLPNNHPFIRDLGVPELTEESSSNLSMGIAWQIRDNLALTLDYYSIDISDRIMLSGQVTKGKVDDAIADATDADEIARLNDLLKVFTDNRIAASQFFFNAAETNTEGTDLVLSWDSPSGNLSVSASTNVTDTKVVGGIQSPQLLNDAFTETDIFNYRDRSIIESWQPASKLIVNVNWNVNQWHLHASMQNYGESIVSNTSGTDSQTLSGGSLLDLRATYNWDNRLKASLGINNATDTLPDENSLSTTRAGTIRGIVDSPIGVFTYLNSNSPFGINGQYVYGEISYRF